MICMTVAVAMSVLAPQIANLPAPFPMVSSLLLLTASFLTTFFLPKPGQFLPTNSRNLDETDKQSQANTILGLLPQRNAFNQHLHIMSFTETQSEKRHNVQRIQLNETLKDTDFIYHMSEVDHFSSQDVNMSEFTLARDLSSPVHQQQIPGLVEALKGAQ